MYSLYNRGKICFQFILYDIIYFKANIRLIIK